MTQSLIIKDGNGNIKSLAVETGSYGYIPVHHISSSNTSPVYITASSANPLPVTGTLAVDVVIGDVINVTASATNPIYVTGVLSTIVTPVTTVNQSYVNSFSWSTAASGTFAITGSATTRKGLSIFNPGPYNLYVALSTAGGTKNGFILSSTSSAPTYYSFIIYPSGTYLADQTNVGVNYGGYFISGSSSSGVYITAIS
jgi:hypothetical protein